MDLFDDDMGSPLLVRWFRNDYLCPQCGCEWEDCWTCACNDRCPNCNLECQPKDYLDLSWPLDKSDYEYAARRLYGSEIEQALSSGNLPQASEAEARDCAEARLEGRPPNYQSRAHQPG